MTESFFDEIEPVLICPVNICHKCLACSLVLLSFATLEPELIYPFPSHSSIFLLHTLTTSKASTSHIVLLTIFT